MARFSTRRKPELVSCILATRNRPRFFRQALRCFLSQTYRHSELIVVDDSERPVRELCSGLDRVRYVRLTRPTPTGTKLNMGIEHAHGEILQKFDDDDYYHPGFLQLAVRRLPARNRQTTLVAWDCFLIFMAGEKQPRFSGHGWTVGATLCFARELWKRLPFRDIPSSVDSCFLIDHDPAIVRVCAPERLMVVRHGGNTWNLMHHGESADAYLGSLPVYKRPLEALVDPAACAFYRSLRARRRA